MKEFKLTLLLILYSFNPLLWALDIPDNAFVQGSNWYCNNGYKKTGNKCEKIDVPANAFVQGPNWYCNIGFKKIENQCQEMSPEEKQEQLRQIQIRRAMQKNETIRHDDYEFTLRDVERKCEVYRHSENYGDVECSGSSLRIVERKCEAYFSGYGDRTGDLECSGSDLRSVERNCEATMYSDDYADIDC